MTRLKQQNDWLSAGKAVLVVSAAALFSILFLYLPRVFSGAGNHAAELRPSVKEFDRRLAEGVHVVQPWSGQSVSFRACRVTNPKMGGFRLGAFHVLEIDDLEIILPCAPAKTTETSVTGDATDPIQRGLDAEKLSAMAGLDQRVSVLKVNGFRLLMTDRNQQRIPVVTARLAKSSGATTISLEHCELLTEQLVRIQVPKAKLRLDKPVLIETAGQQVSLDNLAAGLKNEGTN